jgi:hypothetical protein
MACTDARQRQAAGAGTLGGHAPAKGRGRLFNPFHFAQCFKKRRIGEQPACDDAPIAPTPPSAAKTPAHISICVFAIADSLKSNIEESAETGQVQIDKIRRDASRRKKSSQRARRASPMLADQACFLSAGFFTTSEF